MRARYATLSDLEFVSQDGYVPVRIIERKIAVREIIVVERVSSLIGYARIEFLWSKVPYLALIRVLPEARRQGAGRALLDFLESELGKAGHALLISSSQADEPEPQAWHIRMGFMECGRLEGINADGVDEIFFRKELQRPF